VTHAPLRPAWHIQRGSALAKHVYVRDGDQLSLDASAHSAPGAAASCAGRCGAARFVRTGCTRAARSTTTGSWGSAPCLGWAALRGGFGMDDSDDGVEWTKIRKKEQRGRKKLERVGRQGVPATVCSSAPTMRPAGSVLMNAAGSRRSNAAAWPARAGGAARPGGVPSTRPQETAARRAGSRWSGIIWLLLACQCEASPPPPVLCDCLFTLQSTDRFCRSGRRGCSGGGRTCGGSWVSE